MQPTSHLQVGSRSNSIEILDRSNLISSSSSGTSSLPPEEEKSEEDFSLFLDCGCSTLQVLFMVFFAFLRVETSSISFPRLLGVGKFTPSFKISCKCAYSSSDTKNGLFSEPSSRPSVSLALQKDMGSEPKKKILNHHFLRI